MIDPEIVLFLMDGIVLLCVMKMGIVDKFNLFPITGVKELACLKVECCSSSWRPGNFSHLDQELESHLVGQHLARKLVTRAVKGHQTNPAPSKPLVMSFHGWTGSGKNFVSQFISESMFVRGLNSKYVHLFIATLHFPDKRMTDQYKVII